MRWFHENFAKHRKEAGKKDWKEHYFHGIFYQFWFTFLKKKKKISVVYVTRLVYTYTFT